MNALSIYKSNILSYFLTLVGSRFNSTEDRENSKGFLVAEYWGGARAQLVSCDLVHWPSEFGH